MRAKELILTLATIFQLIGWFSVIFICVIIPFTANGADPDCTCGWYDKPSNTLTYSTYEAWNEACLSYSNVVLNQILYWCPDSQCVFRREDPRTVVCDCYVPAMYDNNGKGRPKKISESQCLNYVK